MLLLWVAKTRIDSLQEEEKYNQLRIPKTGSFFEVVEDWMKIGR